MRGFPSLLLLTIAYSVVTRCQTFTARSWTESYALATELVANLTLSEKAGIVTGVGPLTRCSGNTAAVNRSLPNAPDGFPELCLNDGPAGVRGVDSVTGFPTAVNTGSTFSRRLMQARGVAIAEEFRGKGIHVWLGPAVDLMRNPKAGRGWEGFGADPYLAGEGSYYTILGAQSVGVQACVKHFIAYIQENYRYTYISQVDDRTVHELYFVPFARAIDANVSSVMCAYNQFNGTYNCQNAVSLGMLFSNGFEGYTMSDWGATHPSTNETVEAGLDMEQPGGYIAIGGGIYGETLILSVDLGYVTEAQVDEMVIRIVAAWFHLGQDQGYPPTNFDQNPPILGPNDNQYVNVRTPAHTALAREIAAASSVLLKNVDSALPLTGNEPIIAIIGLDSLYPEQGCTTNECDNGTISIGWGSGTNNITYVVAPLDALNTYIAANATGTKVVSAPLNDPVAGAAAAEGATVAIVFINADSGEYSEVNGNDGDRNDLWPWYLTSQLVQAVAAVNNNTIVVIHSPGPVSMPWCNSTSITAIIHAGMPGEQTGPGLVDVLYGAVNPSGRLPFTIAVEESDYPTEIVYTTVDPFFTINFIETLFIDYRHFDQADIAPLYEFGFGLSYTTFTYSDLSASATVVSFTVENSGAVAGTEIPQLYLGFPPGSGEPPKVLRNFDEVPLAAGASSTVTFSLTEQDISIWDVATQAWVRPSGTFTVYVGASSRDIRLTGTF